MKLGSTAQRLLEKAEVSFANIGYDASSIRSIAEAANANMALIAYHFGSKEGLLQSLVAMRQMEIWEIINQSNNQLIDISTVQYFINSLCQLFLDDFPYFGALFTREIRVLQPNVVTAAFQPLDIALREVCASVFAQRFPEANWTREDRDACYGVITGVIGAQYHPGFPIGASKGIADRTAKSLIQWVDATFNREQASTLPRPATASVFTAPDDIPSAVFELLPTPPVIKLASPTVDDMGFLD